VFVICLFSLTGLYIVIDGFANLDDFMNEANQSASLLPMMAEYYSHRSLAFFDRTSGILTLIAAMFTITWIQRHNELTALEAAGLSKGRIIKPVILAVAAISLLAAANRELIIPRFRNELSHNAQNLKGRKAQRMQQQYDNASNIFLGGSEVLAETQVIIEPDFILPAELSTYSKHLRAKKAYWRAPDRDQPGGYLFDELEEPTKLDHQPSLEQDGKRVVYTPHDTPWLKTRQCFVASGVDFEQLEGGGPSYASLSQLIAGLQNPSLEYSQDVLVAVHSRLMQPFLDVTLLLLGLPLVLSRKNRNMFLAIGTSVILVVWFMGVTMACQALGSNYYISAALAAWLPLLIFVPWAVGTADVLLE
jgi:lipopolysaccharide export system permease protein